MSSLKIPRVPPPSNPKMTTECICGCFKTQLDFALLILSDSRMSGHLQ
jgi:hypothetical protein